MTGFTDPLLMAGGCIYRKNDPLKKVSISYLKDKIRNPKNEIATRIMLLRNIRSIDPGRYREEKKKLPYFVTSVFNPPVRRSEYFGWTRCFVIDLDHLYDADTSPSKVKERLIDDPNLVMAFVSPGGDGLKLMFFIDEKVSDPMQFMLFYRSFSMAFGVKYNLEDVVDTVTSDVTRACFISFDPDLFINPDAQPVTFRKWFDESEGTLPLKVKQVLKNKSGEAPRDDEDDGGAKAEMLTDELYAEIRKRLNPNARAPREKQIFVPEEIEKITAGLSQRFEDFGISVRDIRNIHYGRKFVFARGNHFAEINVFYGKHGFKVVRSLKSGSHEGLLEAGFAVVSDFLYGDWAGENSYGTDASHRSGSKSVY